MNKINGPVIPWPAAAILMASGFSKRFGGRNKLLALFRGKPLARYTLELAASLPFSGGVFLVSSSGEVAALAEDLPAIQAVKNLSPDKGRRESVRIGIESAGIDVPYYLFFPCDQPFLDAATVRQIMGAGSTDVIVEPRYGGRPGNPCLFPALFREELLALKDGESPRVIKARHPGAILGVEVSNPLVLEDIDDEETLERYENNPQLKEQERKN